MAGMPANRLLKKSVFSKEIGRELEKTAPAAIVQASVLAFVTHFPASLRFFQPAETLLPELMRHLEPAFAFGPNCKPPSSGQTSTQPIPHPDSESFADRQPFSAIHRFLRCVLGNAVSWNPPLSDVWRVEDAIDAVEALR